MDGGFEGVEVGERFGGDGPNFAGDADAIVGGGDHARIFTEMIKTEAGTGAGFGDEGLVGEETVIAAAAFERAVDENERRAG